MEISAKSDYAVRALLELADRAPGLVKIDVIVGDQQLPRKFVEAILGDLRRAGIVRSMRGADGGYALARPASEISIGSVIRAVDGPLAEVRGLRPDEMNYIGLAEHLPGLWVAVRASLRKVLDETSLQQLLTGKMPAHVKKMIADPSAWARRTP
ncbi:Rrf2 family transcriptional regulator [Jatrophihabitans telluris]|uniref:Rrf2 family transcriptional regulator n=1 Tax=Jatrophihabitans telluris TaxID=2038343 RepID=A0ABY4QUX5_9ACTN|nr:Rrf2 family transcriptional regulator [Jatrophihabitans telluris]UQX86769.1 Rrf2 family transcriptional regulator [Jatrophihabitans telluris]